MGRVCKIVKEFLPRMEFASILLRRFYLYVPIFCGVIWRPGVSEGFLLGNEY